MINKRYFILTLFILFISSIYGAEHNITSCPATWISGDTYILNVGYPDGACVISNSSVTITSNDIDIGASIQFQITSQSNITFDHINTSSMDIMFEAGVSNDITISNNYIYAFRSRGTTGSSPSGIISKDYFPAGITTLTGLEVYNNYFYGIEGENSDYTNIIAVSSSSGNAILNISDFNIYDNDFINFQALFYLNAGVGDTATLNLNSITSSNNVYNIRSFNLNEGVGSKVFNVPTGASCNVSFDNYDMLTYITYSVDADNDFRNDVVTTKSSGSCNYINTYMLTQREFNTNSNNVLLAFNKGSPVYYDDDKNYYIAKDMNLNATNYIDLQAKLNSYIYLPYSKSLTFNSINGIRLGHECGIIGLDYLGTKPQITTSGTIVATFTPSDADVGNWGLITYSSYNLIDNVDIDMVSSGNYGLLKRANSLAGEFLILQNSNIQHAFVPLNLNTPIFLIGYASTFDNNLIDFSMTTSSAKENMTIFLGGSAGGHLFINNQFKNGGYIFQNYYINPSALISKVKMLHNNFNRTSAAYKYSYPFFPNLSPFNPALMQDTVIELYGNYTYMPTSCDKYIFNIGNYYKDLIDLGVLNDTDSDGIDNIGWLRGYDVDSDSIDDERVLMSYPYDFSTHIGQALDYTYLCNPFIYTITSPTQTNYSSGSDVTSEWYYTGGTYNNLYCYETVNGYTYMHTGVNSSDSMSLVWDLSDGSAKWKVICCDTTYCDGLVKESEEINFCVGNCLTTATVSTVSTPPPDVYGCTNSGATNYNPSATIDDGSCTYAGDEDELGNSTIDTLDVTSIIDVNDYGDTANNVAGFIANLSNGVVSIIIPIAIFLIILLAISAFLALINFQK